MCAQSQKITPWLIVGFVVLASVPALPAQTQYIFTRIVETGTEGSDGEPIVLPSYNFYVSINDSGTVAFNADGRKLWKGDGVTPQLIFQGSSNVNVGPGSILDSGEVAFLATNPGATSAENGVTLWMGNGGTATSIASSSFGGNNPVSANNGGEISAIRYPTTILESSAILRYSSPGATPTAIYRCPVPFNCVNLLSPGSMNQLGMVAFTRIDEATSKTTQVLRGNGNPPGSAQIIAEAGPTTVNGLTTIDSFDNNVSINNVGWIAFSANQLSPISGHGIYLYDGSQIERIVDSLGSSPFLRPTNPVVNDDGVIAFFSQLQSGFCGTYPYCVGIYTGPDPLLDKVVQVGDCIVANVLQPGPCPANIDGKTVESIDNTHPPAINNRGQIVIKLQYRDSSGLKNAVYRADPVPPNQAPILAPIGNKTVKAGSSLTFAAVATDPDIPANELTFSLGPGAPAGATINGASGAFSWTPTNKQGPMGKEQSVNYPVTVQVTDNGSPALTASETISIVVTKKGGRP